MPAPPCPGRRADETAARKNAAIPRWPYIHTPLTPTWMASLVSLDMPAMRDERTPKTNTSTFSSSAEPDRRLGEFAASAFGRSVGGFDIRPLNRPPFRPPNRTFTILYRLRQAVKVSETNCSAGGETWRAGKRRRDRRRPSWTRPTSTKTRRRRHTRCVNYDVDMLALAWCRERTMTNAVVCAHHAARTFADCPWLLSTRVFARCRQ